MFFFLFFLWPAGFQNRLSFFKLQMETVQGCFLKPPLYRPDIHHSPLLFCPVLFHSYTKTHSMHRHNLCKERDKLMTSHSLMSSARHPFSTNTSAEMLKLRKTCPWWAWRNSQHLEQCSTATFFFFFCVRCFGWRTKNEAALPQLFFQILSMQENKTKQTQQHLLQSLNPWETYAKHTNIPAAMRLYHCKSLQVSHIIPRKTCYLHKRKLIYCRCCHRFSLRVSNLPLQTYSARSKPTTLEHPEPNTNTCFWGTNITKLFTSQASLATLFFMFGIKMWTN